MRSHLNSNLKNLNCTRERLYSYSGRDYAYFDIIRFGNLRIIKCENILASDVSSIALNEKDVSNTEYKPEAILKFYNTYGAHPEMGYAPVTKLHLSSEKLMALGWKPQYDLKEMFKKLMAGMK